MWWGMDGIEPLAQWDPVYSRATTPVRPYWHTPIRRPPGPSGGGYWAAYRTNKHGVLAALHR